MQQAIEGTVAGIVYSNDENGYTVLRLQPGEKGKLVTVVGQLPSIAAGERLKLYGDWSVHRRHGRQFRATGHERLRPVTVEAIRQYLGSGLIKGIGPTSAERIVSHFGERTLEIIERQPARLLEVPGLGRSKARLILDAWDKQRAINEILITLEKQGISASLAVRIYKRHGDRSVEILEKRPYDLVRDVHGVDFATADRIAESMGAGPSSVERAMAGVVHALLQAAEEGHTYLPRGELVERCSHLLNAPPESVEQAIGWLSCEREVVVEKAGEDVAVFLAALHRAEQSVAATLKSMLASKFDRLKSITEPELDPDHASDAHGISLTERQGEAVRAAIQNKVVVLTGGPGTGKTTTIRALVRLLKSRGHSVLLAAPTGRAAKRLSQVTGAPARTIHRLLELRPGVPPEYGFCNPLNADMVIIDEASMLDLHLANALVRSVPLDAHLMLVGDVDQLPPVGVGNVLRDVIDSGAVPVVRLDTIFRQAMASSIVMNAHRINSGQMPVVEEASKDFYFLREPEADNRTDVIVNLAQVRLPRAFGLDPLEDVQVLTPVYRGDLGVAALNAGLQRRLNPPRPGRAEKQFGSRVLRVGDKVMQVRNDYEKGVFNGDVGRLAGIDFSMQSLFVRFEDGRRVEYSFAEADELMHSYAVSIHKSQGIEYEAVIVPVVTDHFRMLQRNVIYTAVTRARRLVVLVGSSRALALAVRNDTMARRYTGLRDRLSTKGQGARVKGQGNGSEGPKLKPR